MYDKYPDISIYLSYKLREKFITITTDNGVEFEEMSKRII